MKSFISIIVFFLLKYFINCDECQTNCLKSDNKCVDIDSFHSCPSYCKPNFLSSDNNGCFTCNIGSLGSDQCYYFTNDGCQISSIEEANSKNYKIVINSQCVSSCGENLYQMGDFCYENCIGGNRVEEGTSSKKCKCRYLYEITTENDKTKYNCLDEGEYCSGSQYYDYDSGECISDQTKCSGKKLKTISINANTKITRCSNNCLEGESVSGNNCVEECTKYYKIINGIKTCSNDCEVYDENGSKKCKTFSECKYIKEGNICHNDECTGYIIDNKYCYSTCGSDKKTYTDANNNKICTINCPSTFIKEDNQNECELNTDKCFYESASGNNRICYKSCPAGKYCYDGEFLIRNSCGGDFKYHTENGNICYKSCDLIPSIGGKYYPDGVICRCYFYDNIKNKCYNSEQDCADNDLPYIEDKICKNSECSSVRPYKAIYTTANHKEFYKCYTLEECKANKFYYYYKNGNAGECWVACLGGKHPYENDIDK